MGKTIRNDSLGLKTSAGFRRLAEGRGRGRAAWREAKDISNSIYAGQVAARQALPRLVVRPFLAIAVSAGR